MLDPLTIFGPGGALHESGAELKTPHFYFKEGEAPPAMDALRDKIRDADAYLVVTAECVLFFALSVLRVVAVFDDVRVRHVFVRVQVQPHCTACSGVPVWPLWRLKLQGVNGLSCCRCVAVSHVCEPLSPPAVQAFGHRVVQRRAVGRLPRGHRPAPHAVGAGHPFGVQDGLPAVRVGHVERGRYAERPGQPHAQAAASDDDAAELARGCVC